MKEKSQRPAPQINVEALRLWLLRAIWCLAGITLAGLVWAGALVVRIGRTSGWNLAGAKEEDQPEIYTQAQIDKFITSVLIAVQNQPLSQADAPADLLFIVSFNAFEQRLTVVALANETLVEAESHGRVSLSQAYALGGPGLLVNAMNQNFGLDLQNYACTDAHSLAAMVDLLGGIQTELTESEAAYINSALGGASEGLQPGKATLSGVQSMVHAMDEISGKDPLGSLSRSLNLVHSAVFDLRKTATKEAMLPLLSLIFSNIRTNLDLTALNDWGYEILKAEEIEYRSLILPGQGTWKAAGESGQEIIKADIPANAKLLRQALYNAQ